jgi:hypothetical protein
MDFHPTLIITGHLQRVSIKGSRRRQNYQLTYPERQWLVSDRTATILSNFVAVFLSLATARGFNILQRLAALFWRGQFPVHTIAGTPLQDINTVNSHQDEREPSVSTASDLIDPNSHSGLQASHATSTPNLHGSRVLNQIEQSHTTEGAGVRLIKWASKQVIPGIIYLGTSSPYRNLISAKFWIEVPTQVRQASKETVLAFLLGLVFLLLYGVFITLCILSGLIVTDGVALSDYSQCGRYYPLDPGKDFSKEAVWIKLMRDIESESGEYVKRCYHAGSGTDGCNYFYNQSIPYTPKHNDTCPFQGDICLDGQSSAFTLRTGKVPASTIGINSPLTYTFQRETTCSPLKMDDRFIHPIIERGETIGFRYFYGNSTHPLECQEGFPDCTFELSASWKLDLPSYAV